MKKTVATLMVLVGLAAFVWLNAAYLRAAWAERNAVLAEREGRTEEAISSIQTAAAIVPDHAEYQRETCRLALAMYRPSSGNLRPLFQAKAACERALKADAAYPYHWFEMSQVIYALRDAGAQTAGDPAEFLARALQLDPGNPRFLGGKLRRQIKDGNRGPAWDTFLAILKTDPAFIHQYGPLMLHNDNDYRTLVERAGADPETIIELALYLWQKKQPELSKQLAAKVPLNELQGPDDAGRLGSILLYQAKYEQAEKVLTQALQKDPKNFGFIASLGITLEKQDQWDRAIAHYQEAVKLFPNSSYLHLRLAIAAKEKGLMDLCYEQYHAAAAAPDTSAENRKKIFLTVAQMKEEIKDYEGAINEYRRALEFFPEDEQILDRIKFLEVKIEYQKIGLDPP